MIPASIPASTVSPRIPLGEWADNVVRWMTEHWSGFFDGLASGINWCVDTLNDAMHAAPIIVLIVIFAAIAALARGWLTAVLAVVGMLVIDGLDLLPDMLDTLSQILVASVLAILISVPLGILAARSTKFSRAVRPVLDLMQTLPAYVYLLPFLFLMGLGAPGAILATIIFALPPGVRLTELGIRQVDQEKVEAAYSFGASPREVLRGIQLPLALPTIMAGVNQVIMLSLSMVVIGGIVGAPGLGQLVLSALSQLQVGVGAEAGLGVVILAIYLDRVTDGLSKPHLGIIPELRRLRSNRSRAKRASATPKASQTDSADTVKKEIP